MFPLPLSLTALIFFPKRAVAFSNAVLALRLEGEDAACTAASLVSPFWRRVYGAEGVMLFSQKACVLHAGLDNLTGGVRLEVIGFSLPFMGFLS
jgi:hypothetical protein